MRSILLFSTAIFLVAATFVYAEGAYRQPTCGKNEEYVACKRPCPPETCISLVAKFKCAADPPCESGCQCKAAFLRREAGSPCMPTKQCPEMANAGS